MGKGVCFTGHRPEKLAVNYSEDCREIDEIKYQLYSNIERAIFDGFDTFYTGMARGIDIYAAEIVSELREQNPIKLMAVVPFRDQHKRWGIEWQKRYERVLNDCDSILTLNEQYHAGCMHERNEFMVENSERVIAVFNGTTGGTYNTIKLAERYGRELIYINV